MAGVHSRPPFSHFLLPLPENSILLKEMARLQAIDQPLSRKIRARRNRTRESVGNRACQKKEDSLKVASMLRIIQEFCPAVTNYEPSVTVFNIDLSARKFDHHVHLA